MSDITIPLHAPAQRELAARLQQDFIDNYLTPGRPYPVNEVLNTSTMLPSRHSDAEALLSRTAFAPVEGKLRSTGTLVDAEFIVAANHRDLRVAILFPEVIEVVCQPGPSSLSVALATPLPIMFYDKPTTDSGIELPIADRYLFTHFHVDDQGIRYDLTEQDMPANRLTIQVDFALAIQPHGPVVETLREHGALLPLDANGDKYWVVHETSSRMCRVQGTTERPQMGVPVDNKTYDTRAEAAAHMADLYHNEAKDQNGELLCAEVHTPTGCTSVAVAVAVFSIVIAVLVLF